MPHCGRTSSSCSSRARLSRCAQNLSGLDHLQRLTPTERRNIMRRLRFAKRIAMAAMLVALQVLSNAGAAQAQTITSFDGDKGPGRDVCKSATPPIHCDRAEMDVATNGKQVVQVTWQNVNVYDTTGKLLKSTPLAALIRTTGLDPDAKKDAGPFEPHIVFNEFIDRWIITVTCKSDCTLVSAGSDATGDW